MKSKEPIKLRRRKTASGLISLYLDIYAEGRRTYEFLKMYLVEEKTRADKEKNRQTLLMAEAVRAKRIVELRNGEFGFKNKMNKVLFFDYYRKLCNERLGGTESRGNWGNWFSCLHHLERYEKRADITLQEITSDWVKGFKDYLDSEAIAWEHDFRKRKKDKLLSRNSKMSYFNKLKACLNQAFEEGIIEKNPCKGIEGFKAEEGTRMYLTIEEVRKLADTECDYPKIKAAFLFSCLTGLRRSDVVRLRWGDVYAHGDFTRIIFRQKKTSGQEYLDIPKQAEELMGKRGDADEYVFSDIHSPSCTNNTIKLWVARAGIDKEITFHSARHTFATMMLDLGTDIYTVSKLLGHKQLSTTQIYTKVLDKNKQAAVMNIPDIFGEKDD